MNVEGLSEKAKEELKLLLGSDDLRKKFKKIMSRLSFEEYVLMAVRKAHE